MKTRVLCRAVVVFVATTAAPSSSRAVEAPTAHSAVVPAAKPGGLVVRGRPGFFERLPPREARTTEGRVAHVAALRKAYTTDATTWPAPGVDALVEWREIGLLPDPPTRDDPVEVAQVELGKQLFFDPRLSGSRQIACASCHDPSLGWADGRPTSFGNERKPLRRNAPAVANAGLAPSLFWDGRAESLEDQAQQVMLNPDEMHASAGLVVERVSAIEGYRELFDAAYSGREVTFEVVAEAIAAYERTIVGGASRFDRWLRGDAELTDEELVGLDLFRRDARCVNCHHGPTFSDGKFHNIGLSYYGRKLQDLGRYEHTKVPEDVGKFRTPSLRNASRTGPYMHNGVFPSLRGVVNMYNAGMPTLLPRNEEQASDPLFPHEKSPHLRPLGLNNDDLNDLVAFLTALEEPPRRVAAPELLPED